MPKSLSFVPVSDFRDQIDFAFEAINCHWHACVNEQERVQWFINAMRRFNALSEIACKRATDEDRARYDSVFDLFSNHTEKHFSLWLKARLQSGAMSEDQYRAVMQIENDAKKMHSVH